MSEFDKLKDEGEEYAQKHPQQVKEGEDAVEKKLGIGQQDAGQHDGQHDSGQHDGGQHDGQGNDGQDGA
jgi:hypothetical protein